LVKSFLLQQKTTKVALKYKDRKDEITKEGAAAVSQSVIVSVTL